VDVPDLEQTNLVLRPRGGRGEVYWDAQWRYRTLRPSRGMKKKRLGLAWLEPEATGVGASVGACRDGWLDERAANLAADQAMKEHAAFLRSAGERARKERERQLTVRMAAESGSAG